MLALIGALSCRRDFFADRCERLYCASRDDPPRCAEIGDWISDLKRFKCSHGSFSRLSMLGGIPQGESAFKVLNRQADSRLHVRRNFNAAVERAALPATEDGPVVFHSLRHTGISRLANSPRIPLVKVRDFAGHSKLETTEGYVHNIESPEDADIFAEALTGSASS